MKKKLLFMFTLCLATMTQASAQSADCDSIYEESVSGDAYQLTILQPTHIKNVSEAANWGYNWFIEVKGGASAFLGSPIGCGDVFDRMKPALQVGIGKWFTPAIGGRVEFQGFEFKNAEFNTMKYQFVHADFLYNVTSGIGQNEAGLSRWDVIPFLGVGMIRNSTAAPGKCFCDGHVTGNHPFAFSYGVEARYRLNNRMHVVAEVSGITTFKNFDCIGVSNRFGDNILTASAGISVSIGKVGYKRVIDAKPYMQQNEYLLDYISNMENRHAREIKMLSGELATKGVYPKNNYSGLNSLRARLSRHGESGQSDFSDNGMEEVYDNELSGYDNSLYEDSINGSVHSRINLGVPVYFFFELNSDRLVNKSQLINIDEIALIAKQHGYGISISGAADSATGNEEINNDLSKKRARYIASELIKRGIAKDHICGYSYGGINKYQPIEANRFTVVVLTK